MKKRTGTKEWSDESYNIALGCSHDCRYCYAREMALRFKRVKSAADWRKMQVNGLKPLAHREGSRVMFPTTHDITPEILPEAMEAIAQLCDAGRRVLIVTKAHIECVKAICDRFFYMRQVVEFRFTIGACSNRILSLWEPGAPEFEERFAALWYAHAFRFATSISIEPILDMPNVDALIEILRPCVTGEIWLGKMNRIRGRVHGMDAVYLARFEAAQNDDAIRALYERHKDDPQIRWKDSIRGVVGA